MKRNDENRNVLIESMLKLTHEFHVSPLNKKQKKEEEDNDIPDEILRHHLNWSCGESSSVGA